MLPKTKKKAGYDLIALGTRPKESNNSGTSSGDAAATALNMTFQSLSSTNSSSSSTLANNSNNKSSTSTNNSTSSAAGQPPAGTDTVKNGTKVNSSTNNNTPANSNINANYLDPKTIKEEITKLIDNNETEKLIKMVKSIILNLKNPNQQPTLNNNKQSLAQSQQQQQQQQSQQPDLNFLLALSLVCMKRSDLFLKQPTLVDFICTNLLFTSKLNQDKLNSTNNSVLKSKSLQLIRNSNQLSSIQPAVCSLLFKIFEYESSWPEIFIKAYVDDSLGERSWVDNTACKEFVQNTLTAFNTKSLPFIVDNLTQNNEQTSKQDQLTDSNGSTEDSLNRKFEPTPRYSSTRNEIEILIVDMIRQFSSKQQPAQRILGQSNLQSSSALATSNENRNFLKLLQNACGLGEVRALAATKLETWLNNPKLTPAAQDLLLSICVNVNCSHGDQADKDIISQIIKLKPKIKQQQHYLDCIRELIKNNASNFETLIQLMVLNDLNLQQQHYYNQANQTAQQQQIPPPNRNQHYINILQTAFSTDSQQASKLFAEIMQKILLQRSGEDVLRPLKSLLRDTIKNSRQDFDLFKFTHGLLDSNVPLGELNHPQAKERYANSICDLITVCILVAITPQIKEAYLRRQAESKEVLSKYYMLMAQIQCDTIVWLYDVVFNVYKINSNTLINCMFKVLFMVDKPEQCYSIDNWPSEQERGIMFKVVSEIPVLFETLRQVLIITKSLSDNMYLLMLCVVENLLKQAALVYNKDIYSLNIKRIDEFIELLFSICLYTYQTPPTVTLSVGVLYWKAWQILLIIAALDPKGFGLIAWEKYPTLRLLMEMIMTEDYNYPPQSSITDEYSVEKFHALEIQACTSEKQEILEFENYFELKQASKIIRTEANSNLIDKVMKFDPTGHARRPNIETIQNIRKLNSEYKLGQLLCKSRNPDFLLILIKRQNSSLSLPWLSSLIESSSGDCLEIMPIQCICEFVWNMLSGIDEIPLKKQINIEQLMQRLKQILVSSTLSDSFKMQQITDVFDYFLGKLSSEKQAVRSGSLKIFQKLLINDKLHQTPVDLNQLIDSIKQLAAFSNHLQPLLCKHFRRSILVETNPTYLTIYINFLFEQLLSSYQQKLDAESSHQMETDSTEPALSFIKSESVKNTFNEIAIDFGTFFFDRPNCFDSVIVFNRANFSSTFKQFKQQLAKYFLKFAQILLSLNEYNLDDEKSVNIKSLVDSKPVFTREQLDRNYFLLAETESNHYMYIHEKIFNLIVYLIIFIIDTNDLASQEDESLLSKSNLITKLDQLKLLNCSIKTALNDQVKSKILTMSSANKKLNQFVNEKTNQLVKFTFNLNESLIQSTASSSAQIECNLADLFECLIKKYGISQLSIYLILKQIDLIFKENETNLNELINKVCNLLGCSLSHLSDLSELNKKKVSLQDDTGAYMLSELNKLKEKFKLGGETSKEESLDSMFRLNKRKRKSWSSNITSEFNQNEYTISYLNKIQAQINDLKAKKLKIDSNNDIEPMQVEQDESRTSQTLDDIIKSSTNQNLESNLNSYLNRIDSTGERISLIAESILNYEKSNLKNARCIVDILLDYFCHLDPQIITNQNEIEYQILFELRQLNQFTTQPFLLSLFIHQGDWNKLHNCVLYLLSNESSKNSTYKINPTIALDFLSSLIHIPELWKGTESKVIQKYNEENVLNLSESQICRLIDLILEEMTSSYNTNNQELKINELKFKLNKRVQLLKHFLKQYAHSHKDDLIDKITKHLDKQHQSNALFRQIKNFLLYSIYLEENTIVNYIKNPQRLFSNLYYQIDIPTRLDVIAHNLLNCFGEIEVNYSMNATSSGRIGVASTVTQFKKQEKQEVVAYAKKQEEFMMDANLVCIKLATTHPFIFIRQIPMMEGLLQGRVVYTYDEFKKRKFDKLFHYIIDLLNVLVPYVFHREYLKHVECIVSHYFDVFRSYCNENREANASLVQKFFDFLEKFINTDMQVGFSLIVRKYSSIIAHLHNLYTDINSLKFINSILTIPFDLSTLNKIDSASFSSSVNIFNQKVVSSIWSSKQLEPFTGKILNRENYDGVLSVLQEIDTVSQRQPIVLSHFIFYLQPLMQDINDNLRDWAMSLIMRYLRLNPRESTAFYNTFSECLTSSNSKVFNSAIKIFSDFVILCSEKSNNLLKYALKGAERHNVDISKTLTDSIRLLNLEKYVY